MKILYIFPHPDDESFGPAPAMAAQLRQGHEVHLLTLTKGEATKQRHRLGVSKDEMGEIRYKEMLCVEKVLRLSGMTVLNLPDNELKLMNPIEIENVVEEQIHLLKPDVIVTYAVHGISGFHDHLVTHAVVKRVFCKLKAGKTPYPKRLALFTLMKSVDKGSSYKLQGSPEEEIGFVEECSSEDMEKFNRALDCYKTYTEVIEKSGVREITTNRVAFEIFGEKLEGRLKSITEGL
jgi:N-acetylglucosamine malate deacetylase 2